MNRRYPLSTISMRFAALTSSARHEEHHLLLETGSLRDYGHLAKFHYRSHHPGVVSTIFRVVHEEPTVVGRYLQRKGDGSVVGVLVRALPRLSCRLRDLALRNRYSSLPASDAACLLNAEMRIISRVVIDPRWRGRGIAVRLVRHALEHPETTFTEALATMGRIHPFFERAGMIAYDLPPHEAHMRLIEALARLGLQPRDLASLRHVRAHLRRRSSTDVRWLERELRRWRQSICPSLRIEQTTSSLEQVLVAARLRLLAHPMYYLFDHRQPPPGGETASASP